MNEGRMGRETDREIGAGGALIQRSWEWVGILLKGLE